MAHHTSILSRQSIVIAYFSFWACTVRTDFVRNKSMNSCGYLLVLKLCVTSVDICHYIEHYGVSQAETRGMWLFNGRFYYTTIAYHVGLHAVLGWPQGIVANV